MNIGNILSGLRSFAASKGASAIHGRPMAQPSTPPGAQNQPSTLGSMAKNVLMHSQGGGDNFNAAPIHGRPITNMAVGNPAMQYNAVSGRPMAPQAVEPQGAADYKAQIFQRMQPQAVPQFQSRFMQQLAQRFPQSNQYTVNNNSGNINQPETQLNASMLAQRLRALWGR